MTQGHIKGQKYTNAVCQRLSYWFLPWLGRKCPLSKAPFRARSTVHTPIEGHWERAGDIVHKPEITWPFSVECKKREGWELDGLYATPKWPVWDWWDQCVAQATDDGTYPLLIFSRNRRPDYVMIREPQAVELELYAYARQPVLSFMRVATGEELTLCLLDDLVRVPTSVVSQLP